MEPRVANDADDGVNSLRNDDMVCITFHSDAARRLAQSKIVVVHQAMWGVGWEADEFSGSGRIGLGLVMEHTHLSWITLSVLSSNFRRPVGASVINNDKFVQKGEVRLDG